MRLTPYSPQPQMRSNLQELRIYDAMPGKLQALHDRFANHTIALFKKHGIDNVAYWTEDIGTSNRLVYMLGHTNLGARERGFSAFQADPAWQQARAESEKNGPLDVALDRDFAKNGTIYFCYSDPVPGGAQTALARAKMDAGATPQLLDVKRIFRQEGPPSNGLHYGCRIAQARDGNLFLTTGEHYSSRDFAQRLDNHLGKVIRIAPDGSVPKDNPFVGQAGAKPEIWSYGHRNSQGALIHPVTGKLWMHEHGPRGGDEINIPQAGKNYGWPVIGYGIDYSGAKIHESTHKEGMEQPIRQWTPVIAPSGFAIYQGDLFPAWKGNVFIGGLVTRTLVRLELDGEKVTKEERLLGTLNERFRDVRSGPDGAIWLLTDNSAGRILRVTPAKGSAK